MALLGSDASVTGPFPAGVLLLETLSGTEELGMPYVFRLGLLAKEPNIDPDEVLGKPLAVGIKLGSGDFRYFHGIVTSFEKTGSTRLHTRYAARLNPLLSELNHTLDCRIFNDPSQDAVSIVTSVLAERGLSDVESGSVGDHVFRRREYCVQYRETDLHFVQRLLEEEGIYYFFRHEEGKHTLVLADSISAHEPAAGYETVLYTPEERQALGAEESLWGMSVHRGLYPGRHTVLAGYDASKLRPRQLQFGTAASEQPAPGGQFEHYDYPGGLSDPDEAGSEARLRAQADRVESTIIEVQGNTMGLGIGDLVTLRPSLAGGEDVFPFWDAEGFASLYLVIRASYSLSIDQYESGTVAGAQSIDEPYKATYWLLDSKIPFHSRRTVSKPRMAGPQTALVVGPAGEEIWTDNLGRVRVQLDWDRVGGRNEKSTCWVRVAEMWAGGRWGAMHLPRIGQEVIVRFLDGDPDRPIIAGALYSADNQPPYELPANQTQSGIKSRSSRARVSSARLRRAELGAGGSEPSQGSDDSVSSARLRRAELGAGGSEPSQGSDDSVSSARLRRAELGAGGSEPSQGSDDSVSSARLRRAELGAGGSEPSQGSDDSVCMGQNFNEIRFEDKKGAEELHVQAEKDMSTLVKHCQTLNVGANRSIVVGQDEDILIRESRQSTVDVNDSEVIGGDHDKTVTGSVFQIYGGDHSRKVDGEQDLVEEKSKDEHVKQALTLTTDEKFQLVQDATSMTFRRKNVTLDSAGEIVVTAGGATVSVEKTGMTTFDSPTGIKLVCGGSSLAILPGGIAIASPAVTAAAGAGSVMAMGSDGAAVNGKKVVIEAEGVCSIKGKNKLKLQEAEGRKAGMKGEPGGPGEKEVVASAQGKPSKPSHKQAREKGPVWVRINISPNQAKHTGTKFILTSSDLSISRTMTVRDDMEPGNETVDLLYKDLWKDLSYTLRVDEGRGVVETIFESVPYDQLASLAGADRDGDSDAEEPEIRVTEAVRPSLWAGVGPFVDDGEES